MWQIKKQIRDADGAHRWQSVGPALYATRDDAEKAAAATGRRWLRDAAKNGRAPYSARFKVVLVTATVVACAVMQ